MSIELRAKMRLAFRLSLSPGAHEIEIAAFIGLQNGFIEQVGVAALRPIRRRQLQRRTAPLKLGVIDQEVDAAAKTATIFHRGSIISPPVV